MCQLKHFGLKTQTGTRLIQLNEVIEMTELIKFGVPLAHTVMDGTIAVESKQVRTLHKTSAL